MQLAGDHWAPVLGLRSDSLDLLLDRFCIRRIVVD